jgi:hypothetical protein
VFCHSNSSPAWAGETWNPLDRELVFHSTVNRHLLQTDWNL